MRLCNLLRCSYIKGLRIPSPVWPVPASWITTVGPEVARAPFAGADVAVTNHVTRQPLRDALSRSLAHCDLRCL